MEPLKVFYSYAHEDRDLCEELKKYLIPLKRAGVISDWYDRDIPAGKEWEKEIDHHLGDADLILLLVSADFMASDYCWGVEVERAMERHDKGEARVVPVILRPSVWQDAPFHKLQCLPMEARPVTAWQDRDEALVDVARGIRGAAEELRQIEAQRLAEEKRAAEEKRRAKAQRQAEEQRAEEVRRQEEQRKIAEQRRLEEKRLEEQRQQEARRRRETRRKEEAKEQERQPLPPVENIHGGSWKGVSDLQQQTARTLGKPAEFQDRLRDGGKGPEMVVIPAGEFLMGSPEAEEGRRDDERQHRVVIDAPFAIGRFAVTFDEFDTFVHYTAGDSGWLKRVIDGARKAPGDKGWGRGRRPVINVSWFDAVAYAEWLSEQTGEEYRLPTEAEWEYAARAGTTTPFWFGETTSTEQANYDGNYVYGNGRKGTYREKTVPVDAFEPNPWGLYNVHGNVWEWTCSEYESSYNGAEERCTSNNDASDPRVLRGGSWRYEPRRLRSAERGSYPPGERYYLRGFRLARSFSL